MSVRVVARIRPLLEAELQKDVIVDAGRGAGDPSEATTLVRIPNPKNGSEAFAFQFNSVYGQNATQAQLFDCEVAPIVKHLFKGCDVTLFAYGVTGTGKTHTMRGGKSLAERGVIPRLLSNIYRRARKIEKDSGGETEIKVAMSYYEIYNDRVYDLFESPEKRTPAGLPIRDTGNGKTQVVGLTERPCTTLKEFETLYDQANVNRSTSATKLNAHSSRSHAILCVKLTQSTGNEIRASTASAIDLAGSEDNRRTENNKERLVESASINKSLFVLAQCVEAISKKQTRIPYRESKMTRILSLGQNNGFTVMILNLAPVRSYHLDTLSSLNFANRTKKIEVNEVENLPLYKGKLGNDKLAAVMGSSATAPSLHRQPLRPKVFSQPSQLHESVAPKPTKQFAVYSDKARLSTQLGHLPATGEARYSTAAIRPPKRSSGGEMVASGRPSKMLKPNDPCRNSTKHDSGMSKEAIEALIERKVTEALAERADQTTVSTGDPISDEVQRRLEALEKRIESKEHERSEGLHYLLMAKQHHVRGEDASALTMYQLALPHFPGNEKLARKIAALQAKIVDKRARKQSPRRGHVAMMQPAQEPDRDVMKQSTAKGKRRKEEDESYHEDQAGLTAEMDDNDDFVYHPRTAIRRPPIAALSPSSHMIAASVQLPAPPTLSDNKEEWPASNSGSSQTPRTKALLNIINTRDTNQMQLLKTIGAKRAETIVQSLSDLEELTEVTSLDQLARLKGVGAKTVESMRCGVLA